MTKKDFQLLADFLRDTKPHPGSTDLAQWYYMLLKLVDVLKYNNPRFDEEKFNYLANKGE